ncbi:MAG: hypothetical protein ACK41D_04670 [Rubricoccaceae bacterium]
MDRQSILNNYVTDMAAVEKHILEAVEQQASTDDVRKYPEAAKVINTLASTLSRHVEALEAYNESTEGGSVKEAAKEALGAALGFAAGLYNKLRQTDQVSRMIRDDYTAVGLAAISYHMLHTTALGLKDQRVADMALEHLKDLTPILVDLSKVVCHVVADELEDEDKVFTASIAEQAVRNTQQAWSRETTEA